MEFFILLTHFRKKAETFESSYMSEKALDVNVRFFIIQYGNRIVVMEWFIELDKQGVSEKGIVKLLKLIILGTVNLLISYGYIL